MNIDLDPEHEASTSCNILHSSGSTGLPRPIRNIHASYIYNRFALSDRGQSLTVSYENCVVPDTFRDVPGLDLWVMVEGERCQGCHDFEASLVMAQCPAKYRMNANAAPLPIPRCSRRKQPT